MARINKAPSGRERPPAGSRMRSLRSSSWDCRQGKEALLPLLEQSVTTCNGIRIPKEVVVNALLTPHRRVVWVAWLIVALLCLIGNDLVYGITVPLTASLLVLLAPWVGTRAAGRRVDGRDILLSADARQSVDGSAVASGRRRPSPSACRHGLPLPDKRRGGVDRGERSRQHRVMTGQPMPPMGRPLVPGSI